VLFLLSSLPLLETHNLYRSPSRNATFPHSQKPLLNKSLANPSMAIPAQSSSSQMNDTLNCRSSLKVLSRTDRTHKSQEAEEYDSFGHISVELSGGVQKRKKERRQTRILNTPKNVSSIFRVTASFFSKEKGTSKLHNRLVLYSCYIFFRPYLLLLPPSTHASVPQCSEILRDTVKQTEHKQHMSKHCSRCKIIWVS